MHVFYRMEQRREGLPLEPLDTFSTVCDATVKSLFVYFFPFFNEIEILFQHYQDLKTDLVRTERHLLKEMGFVCHVEHPHKFIFTYLQQLEVDDFNVKQEAWGLANDRYSVTQILLLFFEQIFFYLVLISLFLPLSLSLLCMHISFIFFFGLIGLVFELLSV